LNDFSLAISVTEVKCMQQENEQLDRRGFLIAFYALAPQTLTPTLPAGWKAEEMIAVVLSTDKPTPVDFYVDGNHIKVSVHAQQPIMIYRKKDAARLG